MQNRDAILLVNLGTPKSPATIDVYRYLIEFLTDKRVIDLPWWKRQLLVRGVIVPLRCRQSARSYQKIWTDEGSPLMVYSKRVKALLQEQMGDDYIIEMAMRYQEPSIEGALERLKKESFKRLLILPLFPQYASATTGSVHQKVMDIVSQWEVIPEISFINEFSTHPHFIQAFCQVAENNNLNDYDHILFSFHGLPEQHLIKADQNNHCLKNADCCKKISKKNHTCYSAQCYATANGIANALGIPSTGYTVAFQSRLGKEPWLQPYTSDMLRDLLAKGHKRLLVFSPAFICDCLETIFEIAIEYKEEFIKEGGERLDLVPGLNDHPAWINALNQMIIEHFKRSNTRGNYDSLIDSSSYCCRPSLLGDRNL